jgi:hypothetical protein
MSKDDIKESLGSGMSAEEPIEQQARDQTGQQKIRVHIDERNLQTGYASGFRPVATAEELMLDFGLNIIRPSADKQGEREIIFQANNRIVINYYSAKRLALALGHIIRRYEQEFGEIELNAAKRRVK